jgi:hypothetical protein
MLNEAGIKDKMRCNIGEECASTVTFYADISVNLVSGKSTHKSMFGVKFKKLSNLKRFGEMFVGISKKRIEEKLSNRGTICFFVGYLQNHSDDAYCLFNLKIIQMINSRGSIW